jgi:hypothetical protein
MLKNILMKVKRTSNKTCLIFLIMLKNIFMKVKRTSNKTCLLKHTLNGVGESLFPHTHFTVDYNSNPQ